MKLCAAPLGGFLGNWLSCRVTIILGGLLSSAGLILSSFASSLEQLYFCTGVLTGNILRNPIIMLLLFYQTRRVTKYWVHIACFIFIYNWSLFLGFWSNISQDILRNVKVQQFFLVFCILLRPWLCSQLHTSHSHGWGLLQWEESSGLWHRHVWYSHLESFFLEFYLCNYQ